MAKVPVRKVNINDIKLARALVHKMTKVLAPQFDYIVEAAPDVTFFMCDNAMSLHYITFEDLECGDSIRIDEEYVMLELAGGMHQILFEHEGFYDLLTNIELDDLYDLEPEIQKVVEENRAYYCQFV